MTILPSWLQNRPVDKRTKQYPGLRWLNISGANDKSFFGSFFSKKEHSSLL
jgi:hypothetical protein